MLKKYSFRYWVGVVFFSTLLLFSTIILFPVLADANLPPREAKIFNQALSMMKTQQWQAAYGLMYGLSTQYPENRIVKNNLAIILLNQGELKEAQAMFVQVIELDRISGIAYQNLKKLYSYSAAKTYSEGLKLLKPVEVPELIVLTLQQAEETKGVEADKKSSTNVKTGQQDIAGRTPEAQNPVLAKQQKGTVITEKQAGKAEGKTAADSLKERLQQWRKAWMSGNYKEYIRMYAKNYAPLGKSRKSWLNDRRRKVKPGKIRSIRLKDIKVYVNKNGRRANTLFKQYYFSKNYSDKVLKRLYWIKDGKGNWVIERESVIKVY